MAILSAEDVARYFLAKQDVAGIGGHITNLKLQKLCYYAQGFALVKLRSPLFFEHIEHWQHGPVVPPLWRTYNRAKSGPITLRGPFNARVYTPEIRSLLDEVFTRYARLSALQLRNMTHSESPWLNTPDGAAITHQAMRKHFEPLIWNMTPLDQPDKKAKEGLALATEMTNDRLFMELTERGLADISAGRYSSLKDVSRALGDV